MSDVTVNTERPKRHRQGHGSRACYTTQGCRCDLCSAANALYQRAYRDGLRGTTTDRMGPFRVTRDSRKRRGRPAA